MTKPDRSKEIKRLWNNKKRYLQWDKIHWEPFSADGYAFNTLGIADVAKGVTFTGHFFIAWGRIEKEVGVPWDDFLLYWLHIWYLIPEDREMPFFVNESAGVICFAAAEFAQSVALLFQSSDSTQLGMESPNYGRTVEKA